MASPQLSLQVTMPVAALFHTPEDSETVTCLTCGKKLGLVQPETEHPERLVGTCDSCSSWYLLDWNPGSRKGLIVLLPTHEELMEGFESLRGDEF